MSDYNETIIDEEEPWIEPEWCEECSNDEHIEYEPCFTWKNGAWICDHCGGHC